MKKLFAMLLVFVMLFNICASAIVLDVAEDVVEDVAELASEEAVAELQSTELDIPLYDPTYGRLVYYNNFESQELGDSDTQILDYNYCNTGFIDVTNRPVIIEEINPIQIVEDPVNGGNKVIKIVNESTGRQYPQFWIAKWGDFTAVGTYTLVFDVTSSVSLPIKLRYAFDGTNGSAQTVLTTTANQWSTGAKSYELISYAENANGSYTLKNGWMHSDYTVASDADPDIASFYIDNVRIYYLPKGTVTQESLNLPEGVTTAYKKAANGEKPAEFVFNTTTSTYVGLTDSLYVPGYSFLGWYDADGNKMTPDTFKSAYTYTRSASIPISRAAFLRKPG